MRMQTKGRAIREGAGGRGEGGGSETRDGNRWTAKGIETEADRKTERGERKKREGGMEAEGVGFRHTRTRHIDAQTQETLSLAERVRVREELVIEENLSLFLTLSPLAILPLIAMLHMHI